MRVNDDEIEEGELISEANAKDRDVESGEITEEDINYDDEDVRIIK